MKLDLKKGNTGYWKRPHWTSWVVHFKNGDWRYVNTNTIVGDIINKDDFIKCSKDGEAFHTGGNTAFKHFISTYETIPPEKFSKGDIVMANVTSPSKRIIKGNLYRIKEILCNEVIIEKDSLGNENAYIVKEYLIGIKTVPGESAIDGDDVISLSNAGYGRTYLEVFTNIKRNSTRISYIPHFSAVPGHFLTLVKASSKGLTLDELDKTKVYALPSWEHSIIDFIDDKWLYYPSLDYPGPGAPLTSTSKSATGWVEVDPDREDTTDTSPILSATLVANSTTSQNKGKQTMKNVISSQLDSNKDAAILAAEITAGKVLNKKAIKLIKPQLPMMIRGYADSPLASVILANILGVAIKQYMPDNQRANQVANLMLQASALQAMEGFNIEDLLDQLIDGVKLPGEKSKDK